MDPSGLAPLRGKPALRPSTCRHSASSASTRRCERDASILVWPTVDIPARAFDRVVAAKTRMVEVEHVARSASRRVIGEVYLALLHHDGGSKPQAKAALRSVLRSGLVAASGVDAVLDAFAAPHGGGPCSTA